MGLVFPSAEIRINIFPHLEYNYLHKMRSHNVIFTKCNAIFRRPEIPSPSKWPNQFARGSNCPTKYLSYILTGILFVHTYANVLNGIPFACGAITRSQTLISFRTYFNAIIYDSGKSYEYIITYYMFDCGGTSASFAG